MTGYDALVVETDISRRTQNGHIRNDARDALRRTDVEESDGFAGMTTSLMIARDRA
jgi:hypothetical protein